MKNKSINHLPGSTVGKPVWPYQNQGTDDPQSTNVTIEQMYIFADDIRPMIDV